MNRKYLRGYVQRAEDGEGVPDGPLRIVAATEGMKGDGLNLKMGGVDLARFQSNPVVGYGHSYYGRDGLPIGRSDKTWVDGEKLMMDVAFDADDPFAVTVDRKYRAGYLNAFSIGFDVWDMNQETGDVNKWELFEVSAVPLPMDADALVEEGRELVARFAEAPFPTRDELRKLNASLVQALDEVKRTAPARADLDADVAAITRLTKENERLRRRLGL